MAFKKEKTENEITAVSNKKKAVSSRKEKAVASKKKRLLP
jgi:hypothetical protein